MKLVPLSEDWKQEKKQIKGNINYVALSDLIAIIHTCDVLIDCLKIKKKNFCKMSELEIICSYYFVHCYHYSLSVYHLAKLGFGASSLSLVRTLVESTINLSYLWLCKKIHNSDLERRAWFEYEFVQRHKMDVGWKDMQRNRAKNDLPLVTPNELFTEEMSKHFEQKYEEYKSKYNLKDSWAKTSKIEQRARQVDNTQLLSDHVNVILEEIYGMIYRWTSELVHGTGSSSGSYMEEIDGVINIDFGANYKNVDLALPMTCRIMLCIVFMVNHINNLDIKLNDQLQSYGLLQGRINGI